MSTRDPRACYKCGSRYPTPTMKMTAKICDDPDQPDTCYFITVKVHEGCRR